MAKAGPMMIALNTCFEYLRDKLDGTENEDCWKASEPPVPGHSDFMLNVWSFILSGGNPNERPNYSQAKNAGPWWTFGTLLGQFESVEAAVAFKDEVEEHFPAAGGQSHLKPNVTTFRIASHPDIFTRYLTLVDDQETIVAVTFCRVVFDVIYNKCTT